MRKVMQLRPITIAGLATLLVTGVLQATVPIREQGAARLCMFMVSNCNECPGVCAAYNPASEPRRNPFTLCCNCYL